MILFLLGVAIVHAALTTWAIASGIQWLRYETGTVLGLSAGLALMPIVSAWAAAEFTHLLSPRRIFLRGRRFSWGRIGLGVVCGALAAASSAALLPIADRWIPDGVLFAGVSALWTVTLLTCSARARRGHCIQCGYDLRHSPAPGQSGAGRCPECGAATVPRSRRAGVTNAHVAVA